MYTGSLHLVWISLTSGRLKGSQNKKTTSFVNHCLQHVKTVSEADKMLKFSHLSLFIISKIVKNLVRGIKNFEKKRPRFNKIMKFALHIKKQA